MSIIITGISNIKKYEETEMSQEINIVRSFFHLMILRIAQNMRYIPNPINGTTVSPTFVHEIPSSSIPYSLGQLDTHSLL
jgi:hypothetical protein